MNDSSVHEDYYHNEIFQIILPAFFVCLAMTFTLIVPGLVEEPQLEIQPWLYPSKVSFTKIFQISSVTLNTYPGWSEHRLLLPGRREVRLGKALQGPALVFFWVRHEVCLQVRGIFLVSRSTVYSFLSAETCDSSLVGRFPPYPPNVTINDQLNEDCSCQVGTQVCPANSFSPPPLQKKVSLASL